MHAYALLGLSVTSVTASLVPLTLTDTQSRIQRKSFVVRGGRREGAGRKPGSVSKLDAETRRKATEGGMMPLDYLLGIMRDADQDARSRLDAAKVAAPYCHARLSSTELSGPNGGAVEVQTTQKIDISDLDQEELDILERALQKTIAVQEEC
jgi:hypothetical protein